MLARPDSLPAAPVAPGLHFVRFYEEDALLLDEVIDYLDDALRAGDAAVVIATPAHREEIGRRLGGIGRSGGGAGWYSGELVMLDARETLARFMAGDEPDAQRFTDIIGQVIADASLAGRRRVHAFGEMVALLCQEGLHAAAVRLESLWNGLRELQSFSLFCAYPMRLFAQEEHRRAFRAVCCEHDEVRSVEPARAPAWPSDKGFALASVQQQLAELKAEVARRRQAEDTLKRREKELLDFLENAAEGLHRVGPDGTILWANRAEYGLLGYAAHEYIGRNIAEFYADGQQIARMLQRLNAGETVIDEPVLLRCKDGSLRHALVTSNACFEDGELRHTRCFTRDVTERVQADAERERLVQELEAASRAKDEFLAMLGHELRNPLSPIVTALHLMKLRGDTRSAREQAVIERQLEHLTRLVDDLLDVSRITRGKVELRKERVGLADVLMKAVEMASPLLEQRGHRLEIDVPRQGLACEGDPVRLAQVVSNLLTNAARYTPPGGRVWLRACREHDELVVRVIDNGIGISADMLPQVFDLFFQGRRGIERKEGGLGLGLALVKTLVSLHGGSVSVASEGADRGSEFVVRLPAQDGAAQVPVQASMGEQRTAVAARLAKVLVVDDNLDAAELLGRWLAAAGHTVKVVHDAAAALQALDGFTPEVALLDIGLPVMDGYELATQLRERLRGCRLVALSGYGQDADRDRSAAAGFDLHLVKPVQPQAVLKLIEG